MDDIIIDDAKDQPSLPARPLRRRSAGPACTTLAEDYRRFADLVQRLIDDNQPRTVNQEGDLLAYAQLRWRFERLGSLENDTLNWVLSTMLRPEGEFSNATLQSLAYQSAATAEGFRDAQRHQMAVLRGYLGFSNRIDKWPRAPKSVPLASV